MFDSVVIEDFLVELPPFGSFPMRGFRKMSEHLLATGAYFVIDHDGPDGSIVGAIYIAKGNRYYVEYAKGDQPNGGRDYKLVAESARLLPGEWDGSDRTQHLSEIKNQLLPVPTSDRPAVIMALRSALLRDHKARDSVAQNLDIA